MVMLVAFFFLSAWLLVGPVAVGVRAHQRGRRLAPVAALAILEAAGTVLCSFGLYALAFNGHVEDYGSPPARTLGVAVPALVLGIVMLVGPWFASARR